MDDFLLLLLEFSLCVSFVCYVIEGEGSKIIDIGSGCCCFGCCSLLRCMSSLS